MTENGNGSMVMPVSPMYGNGGMGGFGGWGSDIWVILLVLFALGGFGGMGWGGFGGGFGNMMLGYDFPWLLNGQNGISNNVSDGFRTAQLSDSLNSIQSGVQNLATQVCNSTGQIQTSLCNGFNGVNMSVNQAQNAIAQQLYTNQIADLQQAFNSQTAITGAINGLSAQQANCCCENRLAVANLASDIAREACATRTTDTQNTQSILNVINSGIQSIKDDLCQDRLEAERRENANLRQELIFARGQASQVAQNSTIIDGVYNRLATCPVDTTPVYGRQPIFTCPINVGNNGCGCNNGFIN